MQMLFLFSGILIGAVIAFLFLKTKGGDSQVTVLEKARLLEINVSELKTALREANDTSDKKLGDERRRAESLKEELATTRADNNNLHQKLLEQKGELEQLNQKFQKEFENL